MLAVHPAGRRPPTPAPRATKEVTLGGGRGAAPRRPSAEARRTARQTRGATADSRVPSTAMPGPSPGRWGPLAPPSFLGKTALPALVPALKLNTRAARRPPARWKGRGDRGAPATLEHATPHAAGPPSPLLSSQAVAWRLLGVDFPHLTA